MNLLSIPQQMNLKYHQSVPVNSITLEEIQRPGLGPVLVGGFQIELSSIEISGEIVNILNGC